ncbi:MAG TPA: hypothetical protein PLD20_28915, partial [Blastocatellia bacterium]|nr:hypothetical protein [Blastocatellia bacterium]HMY74272.1 hypothetical protein [Blastocatellia bacterium]HMZ21990.1 hypothetical protein [Blastocatellia bacterium]
MAVNEINCHAKPQRHKENKRKKTTALIRPFVLCALAALRETLICRNFNQSVFPLRVFFVCLYVLFVVQPQYFGHVPE